MANTNNKKQINLTDATPCSIKNKTKIKIFNKTL